MDYIKLKNNYDGLINDLKDLDKKCRWEYCYALDTETRSAYGQVIDDLDAILTKYYGKEETN